MPQLFRRLSRYALRIGLGLAVMLLASCASEAFAPDAAPEYVTIRDFTPFYRLGPQQPRGPDASLRLNTRVKLLRREMGFSYVLLVDERTGYVANENLAVAPPRPPEPKREAVETASRKRGRGDGGPAYTGAALNNTPLPDPNVPPPDLNVEPEIMPDTIPVPVDAPSTKPKFRY